MPFIVQTARGAQPDANAYITVEFFRDYHQSRGREDQVDKFSETNIQGAIVMATDYLDTRYNYVGRKERREQRTQWPRCDAYDVDDDLIVDIPYEVEEATAEYALIALESLVGEVLPNPTREANGRVLKRFTEKVGPLEETREFGNETRFEMPRYPRADRKLTVRGLVRKGGRVRRG